jgi:2-oxoisovalerate dehydrogenase E1 component alpha subunit
MISKLTDLQNEQIKRRLFASPSIFGLLNLEMLPKSVHRQLKSLNKCLNSTKRVVSSACPTSDAKRVGPVTNTLNIVDPSVNPIWPTYQVMTPSGVLTKELEASLSYKITKEDCLKMYQTMSQLQAFDDVFYNAQRQGRISFYMQNSGNFA